MPSSDLKTSRGGRRGDLARSKSSPSVVTGGKTRSSKNSKSSSSRALSPVPRKTPSSRALSPGPRKTTSSSSVSPRPGGKNRAARLMERQGAYAAEMAAKELGKFSAEEFKYEPSAAEIFYEELHAPQKRAIGTKMDDLNTFDGLMRQSSEMDIKGHLNSVTSSITFMQRPDLGKLKEGLGISFKKSKPKSKSKSRGDKGKHHENYESTEPFFVDIDEN